MDIVTQATLGAATAAAVMSNRVGRSALLIGAVGGALADIDVMWGSLAHPALPWELHRHFTHALAFIPIGGLVAALPFLAFKRWRAQAGAVYLTATIAYATHGLLDCCTSYGTHALWPFDNGRVAWDFISIIDPLFTLPLLFGVVLAAFIRSQTGTIAACMLAIAMMYMGLAAVQHQRAVAVQQQLAAARGHVIERGRAMPTFANIVLWRSVYEHEGKLYADGIRLPLLRTARVSIGESIAVARAEDVRTLPFAASLDLQRVENLVSRFAVFADDYMAIIESENPGNRHAVVIGDMRYSLSPEKFQPLWGLRIAADDSVIAVRGTNANRSRREALQELLDELRQPSLSYLPLDHIVASLSEGNAAE